MAQVAHFIAEALAHVADEAKLLEIKAGVNTLMQRFPLYAHRLKG
jgi:glycine hydroxymethyltransferase